MKRGLLITLIVLGVLALVVYSAFTGRQNKMVTLQEGVNAQWSQVANVLQRRADLIPNLVNTVKGYKDFEQETLNGVAEARAKVGQLTVTKEVLENPELMARFSEAQNQLGQTLSRLLSVSENYPDLKSSALFQDLATQLEGTENRITNERMKFNETAREYNTYIKKFPNSFFAGIMNYKPVSYFEAAPSAQNVPQVQF